MFFDQKYLEACSEKTLQANKQGFFLEFAQAVAGDVGEEWLRSFGMLKSDEERIRKVYEDDKIKKSVVDFLTNVQEIYRRKCADTAKKRLLEAETAQKSGFKKKSLSLYSQSILKAPKSDATSSLAFVGRAKLLISLNEYSNALTDLQLALKQKIPNSSKFETFWMMAICYRALKQEDKSKISLNLAEKLSTNPKLLSMLRHSMQIDYRPIEKPGKIVPPITERHVDYVNASHKIAVMTSDESGRYVVANRPITTGETLVVEKPSVACLYHEKSGTHCHHCFERFLAPVGCPDCVSVAFCSPKCQNEAVAYHKYECKFLDLLIGSGMSVLSLAALRSITQMSLDDCLKKYENRQRDEFYRLCSNENKRGAEDFLQRTLMAAFLLRCLQKSGYFRNNNESVVPTDEEYRIGEMLLHYLQILQFNAHEIYETLYRENQSLKGGIPAYIGVGVYPTVALFNHDCYPAVTRHFVGKNIVITSLRPLLSGAQISENYGPVFTHHKLSDRQRSLSARYWFNCRCKSCLEDWPLLNNSSGFVKSVRCPTAQCPHLFINLPVDNIGENVCPKCQKTVSLGSHLEKFEWFEKQYGAGVKLIESKERDRALRVLCDALDVFHRVSVPPQRETHLAEEKLRLCLADCGNTCECLVKI